jgi:hypothetical protein
MKCGCKCNNTLRIPYGNPFRLCICRSNVAPGNPDDITFADIDDLQVTLTRIVGDIPVAHEVMDNGDLMIIGEATLPATAYGIMMTGTYNGHPWRWRARRVFSIVLFNADSSDEPSETFGAETYYLMDVLFFESVDDTMYITTHGHASIEGDTLTLQSTADTDVHQEGDTLVITQKTTIL